MQDVRPGDVLLYPVSVREKATLTQYYGCEVIGSVSSGRPISLSGTPINGVRAIYRRSSTTGYHGGQERVLLARHEDATDENDRLSRELEAIYGSGELITGISCQCGAACGVPKKLL
jgi:hypothetical protein